jgi:hypothetical protein
MSRFPTPHARYRHVFVVMRLPKPDDASGYGHLNEGDVTLTKAFFEESAARAEADRLNELNEKYWPYSVNIARLVEEA